MHKMWPGALVPELLWGTTRTRPDCLDGSRRYHGRVHIVRPGPRRTGWCGLPVDAVWPRRPPARSPIGPEICPECTINYLTNAYPPDPEPAMPTEVLPAVDRP